MQKQIQYFQEVVKYSSFTKAAQVCCISQSAVSQQIKSLEDQLHAKLIERNSRSFSLTPAGEYFYHRSMALVQEFEKLNQETRRISDLQSDGARMNGLKDDSCQTLTDPVHHKKQS